MLSPSVSLHESMHEENSCSELYVTNIDPKVKENDLFTFFEQYGPISAVKVVREKASGKSLSYGFVEFVNYADAERARTEAQYQRIERREILVMFTAERQKLLQEAKVFVKNIPYFVTVDELHEHFSQISPELFVHINTDDKGNRLNFGFVHYMNVKDAETALAKLQSTELQGQKIKLSPWIVKEARQIAQTESRRNLYFRNLPLLKKRAVENSLRQVLSQFGEIESMLMKKALRLNSYYALVSFKEAQSAQNALKELTTNPIILEGATEPFYVSWYQRKTDNILQPAQQLDTLYLHNLRQKIDKKTVREAFEPYGQVVDIIFNFYKDPNDRSKVKKGYIIFEDEMNASNALQATKLSRNVKDLFVNEPELELISQMVLNTCNNSFDMRRRSSDMCYPTINESVYTHWNLSDFCMGNSFQSYTPSYFPMNYYGIPCQNVVGFYPYYTNNIYLLPPNLTNQPSYPPFAPNYPNYQHNLGYEGRKSGSQADNSVMTEQETGATSIMNLSAIEGEQTEETESPEINTSSDELELQMPVARESKRKSFKEAREPKMMIEKETAKITSNTNRRFGNIDSQKHVLQ